MMRICVSIVEPGVPEAAAAARAAVEGGADLVEVRFDLMSSLPHDLAPFQEIKVPKIATLRTVAEGGMFQGDDGARLKFYQAALRAGFEMVDVGLGSPLLQRRGRELGRAGVICSHHDFTGTPRPAQIVDILVRADAHEALPKAAFAVHAPQDLLSIADAARLFSSAEREFVIIGMGELGEITRVCSDRLGSAFAYASLSAGKEAAPGQLDLATMRSLAGARTVLGIVGRPLGHSLSPAMHHAALREAGIPGRYLRFEVSAEGLEDFLQVATEFKVKGFNVTIPHKEAILPLLDRLDASAQRVGAVNVVVVEGEELVGHNTDLAGIESTFQEAGVDPRGGRALVVGAGGAARACCAFLSSAGAKVEVYNRTRAKAEELARAFRGCQATDLGSLAGHRYDIIVNCTPVGMKGFEEGLSVPAEALRPEQFVMDTVYNPPETELLRLARSVGARAANGERMLVEQARRSFQIWTGRTPSYEVMASALREEMG